MKSLHTDEELVFELDAKEYPALRAFLVSLDLRDESAEIVDTWPEERDHPMPGNVEDRGS